MPPMNRLALLLAIAALTLTACWSGTPEKQWYKPNADYTAADFERDRAACTDKKTNALGDECMQQLGWAALGGDIGPAVKAPDPTRGTSNKNKTKY
jgi:hypothetical protein